LKQNRERERLTKKHLKFGSYKLAQGLCVCVFLFDPLYNYFETINDGFFISLYIFFKNIYWLICLKSKVEITWGMWGRNQREKTKHCYRDFSSSVVAMFIWCVFNLFILLIINYYFFKAKERKPLI
jgi:hypothetical protein